MAKPVYVISVVAEMLEIHPQTIRQYERLGWLKPFRTEGNTRRYSDDDVERLKRVLTLTRERGINSAGVDMIMELYEHIDELEAEVLELRDRLDRYG
ncbi:heat shock protein transcriptional repressor HspR [Deferribacterales bacterium RsTz2092]